MSKIDDLEVEEQLGPEILSITALNPFARENAPARCVMFGSHFSQRPTIDGSEPCVFLTGVEEEFGKYTFSVDIPEDATIVAIIPRYRTGHNSEIQFNPETLVIFRGHDTGEYDCVSVPYHCSHDPQFGFKYETKPAFHKLVPGADVPKGTILADSPAVKGDSHYTYAKNLNIIYMSHPNVGLDGYVISRDVLPYFKFRLYERRIIEFGATEFPLNTYGNDDVYKIIPDIGEYIKESGLVAALRRIDPILSPALVSVSDCQRVDYHFDNPVFSQPGRGKVVDISVIESTNNTRILPPQMTEQLQKYKNGNINFYQEIVRFHESLKREQWKNKKTGPLPISKQLHNLIVHSKAILQEKDFPGQKVPLTLVHKKKPLDTFRIEIVIEYEMTPDRGSKFTCQSGGKGVICRIEEPENMPVDDDGNRADIITGPDSVPGRMNIGRLHGPYFSAAARDVRKMMLECIGKPRNFKGKMTIEELECIPNEQINQAADLMLKYYQITSKRSYDEFTQVLTDSEKYEWLLDIFNDRLYTYFPIEDTGSFSEMIKMIDADYFREIDPAMVGQMESIFNLTYSEVTYRGHSGKLIRTKNKARISEIPIFLLDKIANDWLAADIGKHSNFGILTAMNRPDKYTRPWRRTPSRVVGETEGRLYAAYTGRLMIAEMMDRNGNIVTQRMMAKKILEAENPHDIDKIIDRQEIPFGNTRPLQLVNQMMFCMGLSFDYAPEQLVPPEILEKKA